MRGRYTNTFERARQTKRNALPDRITSTNKSEVRHMGSRNKTAQTTPQFVTSNISVGG